MAVDVHVYFNFRSPYCYLASKNMFALFDDYDAVLHWRPLGEWDGRSAPDRARLKIPISRQDVARFARRLAIPFTPPPADTDGTRAAAASLYAEEAGRLAPFVVAVMHCEWGEGRNIGDEQVLRDAAHAAGLDAALVARAADDPPRRARLAENWREAEARGVIGVPTFVIGDQIFWGNDRIEFVAEHLGELSAARQ